MGWFWKKKAKKKSEDESEKTEKVQEKKQDIADAALRLRDDSPVYMLRRKYPEYIRGRKHDILEFMYDSIAEAHSELKENFYRLNDQTAEFDKFDSCQKDILKFIEKISEASQSVLKIVSGDSEKSEIYTGDARIITDISGDGIHAWMFIIPPEPCGKRVNEEMIQAALASEGIVFGIDSELVSRAVMDELYFKILPVARGKYPVNGRSGGAHELFSRENGKINLKEDENGRIDFKDLGIIKSVHSGDVIAEVIPPEKAEDGIKVTGERAEGTDGLPLSEPGKNTVFSDDGTRIVAAMDGELYFENGVFHVSKLLKINSDVDASTGNIDFAGDIAVYGNVREGFSVKCEGNIKIFGHAEASEIKAGGDLYIEKGMAGGSSGTIEAGGSLECRYLENCVVNVGRDIKADQVLGCTVNAGGLVTVRGTRGRIIGGSISGARGIKVQYIGSTLGASAHTMLSVGMIANYKRQILEKNNEISEIEKETENITRKIYYFHKIKDNLNSVQKSLIQQLFSQLENRKQMIDKLQDEIEELKELCKETGGVIEISCDSLRSAVDIEYNGVKHTFDQNLDNFKVCQSGNRIVAKAVNFEKVLKT